MGCVVTHAVLEDAHSVWDVVHMGMQDPMVITTGHGPLWPHGECRHYTWVDPLWVKAQPHGEGRHCAWMGLLWVKA